ncbi:hypothetical protein EV421DRAFT_2029263 [Armillaria borealis]|uniref:Heterokaryon incompatibility domain-containing protein n=1 Tax=Armillaria borealis TaxID=47425 RepID=A0AA39N4D8_9AGAR|nr:hypothetical protein EV421DRAFT_2029263 [Armillaria borealis]
MSESRNVFSKSLKDYVQANRESDSNSGGTRTLPPPWERPGLLLPDVMISSQTEIGQTEESIKVPNQRAYTGRKPVISSSLADTLCSSLGIQGLLDLLNNTLGTSYTLDTPSVSSVLKDCIAKNYDFGTAYGHLRSAWCNSRVTDIQAELQKREAEDINQRRDALDGNRIVNPKIPPRRVWDLYSNRVVPWWSCKVVFHFWREEARPISHAWVYEVDRVDMLTPINGYEWPVPIPKDANLDLIRIEMLNLGLEYTWLDVLCLRQREGPREDLRVEEWPLDVPTIGAIYQNTSVVCYLSGLGLPLCLKEGDLESDRCWFRRAWTVQEIGQRMIIAGDTPDGPLHAKPIDSMENHYDWKIKPQYWMMIGPTRPHRPDDSSRMNTEWIDLEGIYEDEILTNFYKQLKSAKNMLYTPYGRLSAMQNRVSTYPIDKVAGVAFLVGSAFSQGARSIPAYHESQSLEDTWTALIDEVDPFYRGVLLFTYPEPGTGHKKWRLSWEQAMTRSLPKDGDATIHIANVGRDNDDWCEGLHIERGFVRGLAVGGVEGIDRCGELVVEDGEGIVHAFNILASHHYPIPEDTYTLLGSNLVWAATNVKFPPQHWIVGRRLPSKMFEKVSVFKMTDSNEIKRLKELGLSAMSRSILA